MIFTLRKFSLLLVILLCCASMQAVESERNVSVILSDFDNADISEQKKIAVTFFTELNRANFYDEPYSLPGKWHVDSIRAEVWNSAGMYYFINQNYAKGIEYARKALPLLQKGKDDNKLADCMSCLSSCYFRLSDYSNAIKYGKAVLEIDRKSGDKSIISADLNNIAAIYLACKRPGEALSFAMEAVKNSTEARDTMRMAIQMGTVSEIYQNLDKHNEALEYARKAYSMDLHQGNSEKAAIRLCQMAAPLVSMKKYDSAEKCLLKALPVLKQAGNMQSYSIACNQLGSIALERHNMREAVKYYDEALPFFTSHGDYYNESKTQEGLYRALKASDPKAAAEHLERFCLLKDSIYHRDMEDAIGEYNARYKNGEMHLKYKYEVKLRNTVVWISALLIFLAVWIIVLLLYINRQRKQKFELIRESELMRVNFFTNITHEFRTPLTVIQSGAQELLSRSDEDAAARRAASDIFLHGQRLLNLINQLLEIARMSSARMPASGWRHGDIVEYIGMLCESHRAYAAGRGIGLFYIAEDRRVEMDFNPDAILKIVQNLLSNAIKFSKPGSNVTITTEVHRHSFIISVRDEGKGMSAEQTKNIFKPFFQATDDNHNIGTGIGLSLVKLVVESLKGRIEVCSEPEKGSEFIVTIPILKQPDVPVLPDMAAYLENGLSHLQPEEMVELTDDSNSDGEAVRILIVEDSSDVAHYIKRQLNPDYNYFFACNGKDGFEKAEQLVPDIIITDCMMPGMDGFELCGKVRASELLNHIPVIMVTAKATHEDRIHGLNAGADAYIEKPFHADELNMRVEKLMEQRRLLRKKFSSGIEAEMLPDTFDVEEISDVFLVKLRNAVLDTIEKGKIDYDALAYGMCVSRAQLNRKVKAMTGLTTTEFILQVRMSLAKQLLDTSDMPVWNVADRCGIDNDSYFCTLFKKVTGLTPLQYKNRK